MKDVWKYPIEVVELIQKYERTYDSVLKIVDADGALLTLTPTEATSNYHFQIKSHDLQARETVYVIQYQPKSRKDTNLYKAQVGATVLEQHYQNWLTLIKTYISLTEEPHLQQSEQEFYDGFELIDEDAATTYFSTDRQIFIDRYLDYIIKELDAAKTDQNASLINEIIDDAVRLQEKQTTETKKVVIERLSKILAKTKQAGIKLLLKVYDEAVKEAIKYGVKYIAQHGSELSGKLNAMIAGSFT